MSNENYEQTAYGFKRVLDVSFDEARQSVTEALKVEGFGVLTEIDLKEKFREKLDKDFRNYVILGACNPGFAFQAVEGDIDIGLLLPCNVIVYEDGGKTVVNAIDPEKAMSIAGGAELAPLAKEVGSKLRKVIESL